MKTLKGWITTGFLVAALAMSATSANAGIIIAGLSDKSEQPCTETTTTTTSDLGGIIIAGLSGTGIIIAGLTGIIIAGASDSPTNCGIIIAG
jgi:hypothetical protein